MYYIRFEYYGKIYNIHTEADILPPNDLAYRNFCSEAISMYISENNLPIINGVHPINTELFKNEVCIFSSKHL